MQTASAPRSFLAPDTFFGFQGSDWLEIVAVAFCLVLIFLYAVGRGSRGERFFKQNWWLLLFFGALPIALRLLLLPHHPAPTPNTADDFSFLLLGDTLHHFRLANQTHPFHRFFEAIFVMQEPSYSSMYPPGQGLVLAAGQWLLGMPWAGVLLSVGVFTSLCYWALCGWMSPVWAFGGGLLAVAEFGPLSYWSNCYWGGAVTASAGCLVVGALPRLAAGYSHRSATLLGLGLGVQLITRPFEFVLLLVSAVAFLLLASDRSIWLRTSLFAFCAAAPFVLLMLGQNKAVTGSWMEMPYLQNRDQYGVPTTFTFQPPPVPHREMTGEQELDYRVERSVHGETHDTLQVFCGRLLGRVRFYRFFLLPPLYLAFAVFVGMAYRERRHRWIAGTLMLFAVGTTFFPFFYPHYLGTTACLFVLASLLGLQRLHSLTIGELPVGRYATAAISALGAAHFLFWYGLHLFETDEVTALAARYETWDYLNTGDPEGRARLNEMLNRRPKPQLVFVRYSSQHGFHEWIHNAADIDRAHIVWAHDLGPVENEKLHRYYPQRTAWLLQPDRRPLSLTPYRPDEATFEEVP